MYPRTRFEQVVSAPLRGVLTGAAAALIAGVAASFVGRSDVKAFAGVSAGICAATVRFVADALTWYDRT